MSITTFEGRLIAPICIICAIACLAVGIHFVRANKTRIAVVCSVGATAFAVVLVAMTFVHSESRQASNCTVTVYNSKGLITEIYNGKLDITEKNAERISFRDENGEPHTIANTDGIIIVEEDFQTSDIKNATLSMVKVYNTRNFLIDVFGGYNEVKEDEPGFMTFENTNGKVVTILYTGIIIIDEDAFNPTEDAVTLMASFDMQTYF
ncbi:MAG: hypothetical protein ACI4VQ_07220 [Clostridia bacterium]